MSYGESISGAMLALRDILRTNLAAQIAIRQLEINAEPTVQYTLPTIETDRIRLRQVIVTELPQLLPAASLVYVDRRVVATASRGVGNSELNFWVQWWVTDFAPDLVNGLDVEEIGVLICADYEQAVLRSFMRNDDPSAGIFGKADNSIQGLDATSDLIRTAYIRGDRAYTLMGQTRYKLLHRPDY
jgi:hypothetical protein